MSEKDEIAKLETELGSLTGEILTLYKELTLLYDISQIVGSLYNLNKITSSVVHSIVEALQVESALVVALDQEEERLEIKASYGLSEEANKILIPLGEGILGLAAKKGEPRMGPDVRIDPTIKAILIDSSTPRPYICVPMKVADEVVGLIMVIAKEGRDFSSRDLKLLSCIASQTAIAIKNVELISDLKWLFLTTVKALSSAIETKDPYTHGHSDRVTYYSLAIADELGLSLVTKENVRLAGILHDIGKIGVPVEILRKPSSLTEEEYAQIKKHPFAGSQIVEGIRQLMEIVPAIRHHHEQYDGEGYPDHLKGDEIPLLGRILAVADAFDAMTSDRPYRKAGEIQAVLNELRRCAGSQFDPKIVDAFFSAYEKGKIKRPEGKIPVEDLTIEEE